MNPTDAVGRSRGNGTVPVIDDVSAAANRLDPMTGGDVRLGWNDRLEHSWRDQGSPGRPGRAVRLDRGWSTIVYEVDGERFRARNIGADVAVGDWVVISDDGERVESVIDRYSAFTRRASFEGNRAVAHTIAANIDTVVLVHSLTIPPNQRRLERELVLAFDSGAAPAIVLTKSDLVDDPLASVAKLEAVAVGVPVMLASGISGEGVEALRALVGDGHTMALLGASGVGKSTLINALVGDLALRTAEVRDNDQRGRHTTTACELVRLPGATDGWLIDTPGVRAVSLWSSGQGIERAFADVFDLSEQCRFRDCKHKDEPGCAVHAAIEAGTLDPRRLDAMTRLVAEELSIEEEQRAWLKTQDRRGVRKRRPAR
jgi:ribosome biogenesis GTPase / thiamine phosphate phosphatase